MDDGIRFTIISDDTERALAESFGCAPSNRPDFVRFISDPQKIDRLPDDSKVLGMFYSRQSPARSAFIARRMLGGFVWLDDDDYEQIHYWVKLHRAAMEERAMRYPDEMREPAIEDRDSVISKPQPEVEKLVMSQRWT